MGSKNSKLLSTKVFILTSPRKRVRFSKPNTFNKEGSSTKILRWVLKIHFLYCKLKITKNPFWIFNLKPNLIIYFKLLHYFSFFYFKINQLSSFCSKFYSFFTIRSLYTFLSKKIKCISVVSATLNNRTKE